MRISDWSSDVCSSDLDAIAVLAGAGLRDEIDIIDFLRAIAIHKVKVRAANALNSGNVEFHWTGFAFYRRSAPLDRQLERLGCIMFPEGHGIRGRSMPFTEDGGFTCCLTIETDVYVLLPVTTPLFLSRVMGGAK